jgi:hypothetical protein
MWNEASICLMFFREHVLPPSPADRTNSSRLRFSSSGQTGSGIVASRAEEHRRRAQHCLEMAHAFGDRDARVILAQMAQAWLRLADSCQDAKQLRPAMQQQHPDAANYDAIGEQVVVIVTPPGRAAC